MGYIEKLKPDQVFVFGSNAAGFHGAGSAGYAMLHVYGNKWRTTYFFALRKTPANDLNKTGIVIEFECLNMVYKEDYERVKDLRAIRNEREVAIYNTDKMTVTAFWHFENGWKREILKPEGCS